MLKYIFILILSINVVNAQTYKDVLKQISSNNKEIKAYKEYLNSVNIESKTSNLPLNPKVEYSYLSASGNTTGSKQEFMISQPFEFPTKYFLKSDISSLQISANQYHLKEFEKTIINKSQNILIEYIYSKKKVDEFSKRLKIAANMLETVQIKFDKGDVGILELNKAKSNLSISQSRLNMMKIEMNSALSKLVNINGGEQLELNSLDYWMLDFDSNFETLFNKLKKADNNNLAFEEEKKLFDKKLSLAKSGWLPNFDFGYRQENEEGIAFKGVNMEMSIPLFENSYKVPKAESELNLVELKIQSYNSKFYIEKKMLFDKSIQLKATLDEQRSLVEFTQLELNKKSYELGHISLTQFYIDNTIYYEIIDSILETEMEYYKTLSELFIEITMMNID